MLTLRWEKNCIQPLRRGLNSETEFRANGPEMSSKYVFVQGQVFKGPVEHCACAQCSNHRSQPKSSRIQLTHGAYHSLARSGPTHTPNLKPSRKHQRYHESQPNWSCMGLCMVPTQFGQIRTCSCSKTLCEKHDLYVYSTMVEQGITNAYIHPDTTTAQIHYSTSTSPPLPGTQTVYTNTLHRFTHRYRDPRNT